MRRHRQPSALVVTFAITLSAAAGAAQLPAGLTPAPPPQSIPEPGPATAGPYAPRAILPGGVVVTLYPPGSPFLKADRVREPEVYNMTANVPGRIQSIVNIHNPSIEFHPADRGTSTGAVVILVAGGGHNTLNVGTEGSDFVPFFYQYGVGTIILRNRLRRDGYDAQTDAVYDAEQAIRMVRARAQEWQVDPRKIGIMGFSAGAELAAPAAVSYPAFEAANASAADPLAGISARPDFVVLVYPGPTPFARNPGTAIPADAPPVFITSAGSGDAQHAIWADELFAAFLKARVPNLEMHIYGNGVHANGMKDRDGTPFGTWHVRLVDWVRDLGFLQKPGVETRAARDVAAYRAARERRATSGSN
ncbi:MAG: alpha/beta hydrolase fold domain-containing protein [Acidobacteria bacterium]|nr:alpha/beta hydrolase fold domain-containing protein [Acidobacteriota bacterium]